MYTITSDSGITVEAETLAQAKRQLAKEERRLQAEKRLLDEKRDAARDNAKVAAYTMLSWAWEHDHTMAPAWTWCRYGSPGYPVLVTEPNTGSRGRQWTFDFHAGNAVLSTYGCDIEAVLFNGCGYPLAIVTVDLDNGRRQIYAIGAADDVAALATLPESYLPDTYLV